jgi:hypothetical protein
LEVFCFGTFVERGGGETTQDDVCGCQIDEDESALFEVLEMAFFVGGFEAEEGGVEPCDGEVVSSQIVEIGDAFRARIRVKRARLCHDQV